MNEDLILIRREPPLGWVTINRPDARNALNAAMWQALAASGVLRLCQQALQSPLACNIDQSWVRRQYAPDIAFWTFCQW